MDHQHYKQEFEKRSRTHDGEVSEWFKELVLKTSDSARGRGFESHSLRQSFFSIFLKVIEPWRRTQVAQEAPLLRE